MRRRQFLAATAVTAFLRAASPTAALARQQLLSGLYLDAVASYAAALTERDSDPELHAGYIHALVAAKKARAAADAASRARDRFGDDPHVIAAHARVLFRQARLAEASQGFKQAIDKNPKVPEA
jgi:Flp pilus assembly protein TadD